MIISWLYYAFVFFVRMTEGYSASDLKALASDASLGPIRGTYYRGELLTHWHVICVTYYITELDLATLKSVPANRVSQLKFQHRYYNVQWNPSKAATIGTKDFGDYTGVAITQGSYKPRPLKWPFGSRWKLQYVGNILLKLPCLWLLRLPQVIWTLVR